MKHLHVTDAFKSIGRRRIGKSLGKNDPLIHIVTSLVKKRKKILQIAKKYQTPFYLFDKSELIHDLIQFKTVFSNTLSNFKPYYAYKINSYAPLVKEVIAQGYGLDVASGVELRAALDYSCTDILYYSPGKSDAELELAIKNYKKVRIHIDSFHELDRIGIIANKHRVSINAGVRIHLQAMPQWVKFGIHVNDLHTFWSYAKKYPSVRLQGIHFHSSRNNNATAYIESIRELGQYLKKSFSSDQKREITYIDFGGGFEPYNSEGYYPYEFSKDTTENSSSSYDDVKRRFSSVYKVRESITLQEYATEINMAIQRYLAPQITAAYYSEPGRIICNNAMHIILSVADKKNDSVTILDGGINMIGWQRYMYEYFPVINVSKPSLTAQLNTLYGNLCTTRDIWGYSCYAKSLNRGDIIAIPNQGALTYSIAQNWIQNIPNVYPL